MCMKVENKKSQRPREGDKKKKKCNAMTLKTAQNLESVKMKWREWQSQVKECKINLLLRELPLETC